jgi:putative transposase
VDSAVGLDLGVSSLVTLSTGEKVTNPKTFDQRYHKLKQAQKSLSRKQKGSQNRAKARLEVARIQAKMRIPGKTIPTS